MSSSFLLDTHAVIWALQEDQRLSAKVRPILADPACPAAVSVVSIWEIVLKCQAGKLQLGVPLAEFAHGIIGRAWWSVLALTPEHLTALYELTMHHKDPFDRLLVAQAKAEGMTLVTNDAALAAYGISTLW